MTCVVKLFAGLAEAAGQSEVQVPLPDPPTVGALRQALRARWPAWERELQQALVAVNLRYAEDSVHLQEDDEIALIPPVGGGAKADHDCRVQTEPLDIAAAYAFLVRPECGGTVLFSGTVREWTGQRRTAYLEYEAYEAMALTQMQAIAAAHRQPGVLGVGWREQGQGLGVILRRAGVRRVCRHRRGGGHDR
ncbi:MAG: MoaD/ThiS family protein, partial [Alicyclobacillus sp.]|nr:MoaD/ThiS family protein [Alicyclobacillus sp.]